MCVAGRAVSACLRVDMLGDVVVYLGGHARGRIEAMSSYTEVLWPRTPGMKAPHEASISQHQGMLGHGVSNWVFNAAHAFRKGSMHPGQRPHLPDGHNGLGRQHRDDNQFPM